jgi:hypothetical protein
VTFAGGTKLARRGNGNGRAHTVDESLAALALLLAVFLLLLLLPVIVVVVVVVVVVTAPSALSRGCSNTVRRKEM